jgi:hypothetical protein
VKRRNNSQSQVTSKDKKPQRFFIAWRKYGK